MEKHWYISISSASLKHAVCTVQVRQDLMLEGLHSEHEVQSDPELWVAASLCRKIVYILQYLVVVKED